MPSIHISFRSLVFPFSLLCAGCTVPPPDRGAPGAPDEAEVVLGRELPRAIVSLCVTREQAETVLKTHREEGPEAALKAFDEQHCFTTLVSRLRPLTLVSSQNLNGQIISLVEVSVPTGQRRHVLYMITRNPVALGVRV